QLDEFDKKIAATQTKIRTSLAELNYADPATQTPPPAVQTSETVWFEDGFPEGVKVGALGEPTTFVTKETGPVFSGNKALKRTAREVAQDYFETGLNFTVPPNGKISAYCYVDPENPPKAVMLQFHVNDWNHR